MRGIVACGEDISGFQPSAIVTGPLPRPMAWAGIARAFGAGEGSPVDSVLVHLLLASIEAPAIHHPCHKIRTLSLSLPADDTQNARHCQICIGEG